MEGRKRHLELGYIFTYSFNGISHISKLFGIHELTQPKTYFDIINLLPHIIYTIDCRIGRGPAMIQSSLFTTERGQNWNSFPKTMNR